MHNVKNICCAHAGEGNYNGQTNIRSICVKASSKMTSQKKRSDKRTDISKNSLLANQSTDKGPKEATLIAKANTVGNEQMAKELRSKNGERDQLLGVITARMEKVHAAQNKEAFISTQRDRWFLAVHKGADTLPEPKRWCEVARLYREAALAICGGNIGRGAQLATEAIKAENEAHRNLPKMVRRDLNEKPLGAIPLLIQSIGSDATCSPCHMPNETAIAERVEAFSPEIAEASTRKKKLHNWWDKEDEEEEGKDKGGDSEGS
jgi:hypothetical protein